LFALRDSRYAFESRSRTGGVISLRSPVSLGLRTAAICGCLAVGLMRRLAFAVPVALRVNGVPRRLLAPLLSIELIDLLHVVLHRVVGAHALELRPRVVLRAADEVESAGPLALDVPFGRLLVVRI